MLNICARQEIHFGVACIATIYGRCRFDKIWKVHVRQERFCTLLMYLFTVFAHELVL